MDMQEVRNEVLLVTVSRLCRAVHRDSLNNQKDYWEIAKARLGSVLEFLRAEAVASQGVITEARLQELIDTLDNEELRSRP